LIYNEAVGRGDALCSRDVAETKRRLNTSGWKEQCNHVSGDHRFCSIPGPRCNCPAPSGHGPFLLLRSPGDPGAATRPVWRCIDSSIRPGLPAHSVASSEAACHGQAEAVLGYAKSGPSSAFPRSLRSCKSMLSNATTVYYSSVGAECMPGDTELELLGFVS
jgi:hypothetical protein